MTFLEAMMWAVFGSMAVVGAALWGLLGLEGRRTRYDDERLMWRLSWAVRRLWAWLVGSRGRR